MRLFLSCTLLLANAATARGGEHAGPIPPQPVTAVFPERWTPPLERRGAIDFAMSAQADAWLRHGVLGDPSFDSFERRPGNPIVRGKPPFNWPVNGFLFENPKS